jgi:glycosyltransferase involved in cell wall biosynthesis
LGYATRNEIRLIVITRSDLQNEEAELGNLLLIKFHSDKSTVIAFALSARKRLRNENIKLMVVGDPWTPFYTGLLIRVLLGCRIPIQVQLHADLFSKDWLNGSAFNQMKSKLALPAIKIANSVRFVSQSQLNHGLTKFRWLKGKSFIAPVYLDEPICKQPRDGKNIQDEITLGLLGRIHQDRGLDKLVPLLMPIIRAGIKIHVVIAGEGQYKKILQDQTDALRISDYFSFIGHVSGEQLNEFWEQIDVLVSMAPSESYGRSIREALLAGVPIWAIPSSGVMELKELVAEGDVSLIDLQFSPEEQISRLREILMHNVSIETKETIISENQQGIRKLIDSWVGVSSRNSDRGDL